MINGALVSRKTEKLLVSFHILLNKDNILHIQLMTTLNTLNSINYIFYTICRQKNLNATWSHQHSTVYLDQQGQLPLNIKTIACACKSKSPLPKELTPQLFSQFITLEIHELMSSVFFAQGILSDVSNFFWSFFWSFLELEIIEAFPLNFLTAFCQVIKMMACIIVVTIVPDMYR